MEECSGCKELIWDYRTGDIICSESGEICEKIYVEDDAPARVEGEGKKSRGRKKDLQRSYRAYFRLLKKAKRKGLLISEEGFMRYLSSGKQVMVFSHPKTPSLMRFIMENEIIRRAFERVSRDPRFSGRTLRAKAAAAMILASSDSIARIAEVTGLSPEHIARLRKLLKEDSF
ncbi:MAG: hypothetical protein ACP5TH_00015 [Fervidicoccaceae archaeon]